MDPFDYAGALRHISPNKPQDGVPDTGMGNGARLDDSYQTALADRENQDSLSWLMQDDPGQEPKPGEGKSQAEGEAPAEEGGVLDTAKAVGSDVLTGVTSDAANVFVGGPMRGIQNTIDAVGDVANWIDQNVASLGGVKVYDAEGNFDPELLGPEAWAKFAEQTGGSKINLPNIGGAMDDAQSTTGAVLQGIAQFLTGFVTGGKLIKGGSTAATFGKAAFSDFFAFGGQDGNIANLIEAVPALQNPITEFLATDENTPEFEGRFKNTLANFLPSAVIEPVFRGLNAIREARRVKALTGGDTYEEAATRLAKAGGEAQPSAGGRIEQLLGNPSDDLVRTVDTPVTATEAGHDATKAKKVVDENGYTVVDVGARHLSTMPDVPGVPQEQVAYVDDLLERNKELRRQGVVRALLSAKQIAEQMTRTFGGAHSADDVRRIEDALEARFQADDLVKTVDTALAQTETGVPDHVAAKSLAEAKGAHKAEDVPAGMKRLYTVERDGQPIAPETDDLATAQAAIKAEGGTQGETHQIVFRDVPVEKTAPADPGTPPPLPEGLQQVKGIRVFHGSPHDFDKFEMSKIGTGEGAQAYGHGLYFAEAEDVAKSYRDNLRTPGGAGTMYDGASQFWGSVGGTRAEAADAAARRIKELSPNGRAPQDDAARREWDGLFSIESLLRSERVPDHKISPGRMYEVSIKAEPEQFLDWDKPIGQQSAQVQAALTAKTHPTAVGGLNLRDWLDTYAEGKAVGGIVKKDKQVEPLLREAGIPGIRYLDGGSRSAGEGSHNYVVFDEDLIEIVGKDGQKVTGPELDDVLAQIRADMTRERPPEAAAGGGGSADPPSAPPVTPDKGPPFSREVFVNWARIDTPDDVKRVLGQMADAFAPEIAAKQRGVRTNAQTADAAGQENAWKLLIGERKGNLPNAEETLALRQLYTASGEKLLEVSKLAMTGDAEASFAFRRMMAVHNMIQQEVMGIRTETARALQQWRIPAGGGAEKMKQLEFALRNHGGLEVTQALAQRIATLAGQPGSEAALDQLVRKGATARTMDAVREAWINAILSGPKTHIVNMMSNSAVIGQSIIERAVAGRIGHILNPVDGVKMGEATAMQFGVRMAYRDALRNAWKTLQTGESGFGMGQIEGPRTRAISSEATGVNSDSVAGRGIDMIGSVVNIPGRALTASDEFFKSTNYRAELWAQAYRTASEEVERGALKPAKLKERIADIVNDPPEDIRLKAADMAAYNTFTSPPGEISQRLMKLRNGLDESTGTPIGTMLMPFINTPGNIMKYAFERTPLAPLMSRFRADMAAGGARRDLALARMGLGSITLAVALDLAMDGHITGRGPAGTGNKDAGQRQAQARIGWQKYSIRIPTKYRNGKPTDYRYYAFNRADPVGGQLAMAAELAEAINNSDGTNLEGVSEVLSALVLSNAQIYMNKSYFSGITKFIDAVTDPERYGESYFNSLAESFVPTGVAEAARFVDPVQRHVTNMTDGLIKRTPGLSSSLPPRLDFWGKPIEYGSGLGPVYDALSPIYSKSTEAAEPIDKEFFKLNYFPTHAASIRVDGGTVNLKNLPKARNALIEYTANTKASKLLDANEEALFDGRRKAVIRDLEALGTLTLKEALNGIVTNSNDELVEHFVRRGSDTESYLEADTDEKQQIIKDVISAYRSAATLQVVREFPEISERRARQPSRDEAAPGLPY